MMFSRWRVSVTSGAGEIAVGSTPRECCNCLLIGLTETGNREDPVHIKSIKISPDPPKPGEVLTVSVIGEATERVEVRRTILVS